MSGAYTIGKMPPQWSEDAQTITFIVTEDCNLRCKYCYITHKASNKRMNFETAKNFIDYILTADISYANSVVIEFFGGEPMIEMALVDQISDYFKLRAYELNHRWAWNYRFNFSTNGVNYASDEVQSYIKKNIGKLSVGISIDGTKQKHDLNRVFPDGSGSYDIIEQNIPLWRSQFVPATKMTFAHEDLPYLKESVIDLWNHGVTEVASNVVFEDVWHDGDDKLFEEQLRSLADYILDNQLYDKYYCTFFSDTIGGHISERQRDQVYCGAGKMLAVGPDGKFYPCVRYKDYSLNNHKERVLGTVNDGIDMERVRPFMVAASRYQDDEECTNCPVAAGCPQCQGLSYDVADTETYFQRAKFICKMQKARVRANEYFFSKLYNRYGIRRDHIPNMSKLYFLLSDNFVSFCCYENASRSETAMTLDALKQGLSYCRENFFSPIFVHGDDRFLDYDFQAVFEEHEIQHILPARLKSKAKNIRDFLLVFDHSSIDLVDEWVPNCIYNIKQENIAFLAADIIQLFGKASRINVNILGLNGNFDEAAYSVQLEKIKDYLIQTYAEHGTIKELNILTDILYADEWSNCRAGERTFVYAPDGQFYVCPAFYQEGTQQPIGCPDSGMNNLKNAHLYQKLMQPLCQLCDAKQCRICIYRNQAATGEVNVSPSYQCRKSHIERKVSVELQNFLGLPEEEMLKPVDYLDPIVLAPGMQENTVGYYKV